MAAARKIETKPLHMKGKSGVLHRFFLFGASRKGDCVDLPTIDLTTGVTFPLSATVVDGSDLRDRNARIVSGSEDSSTKGCLR
ncbi:MAG: hypothetical protein RLZZ139_24 [Cyanobacteriota bacterium]